MTAETSSAYDPPGWREQRLLIQRCNACGHTQYYPRSVCLACSTAADLELVESAGRGRLYSFTEMQRAVGKRFDAPGVLAIVRLDEDVLLLSRIVGASADALTFDMAVTVEWDTSGELPLPVFTPL